jgi:glycerol-3-phosphate dehydrogenase
MIEPDAKIKFPVLSLVGGKWTTFRAFSEQSADAVMQRIGRSRKSDTKNVAIGGGKGYPVSESEQAQWLKSLQQKTNLPAGRVKALFDRYGTYANEIAAFCAAEQDTMLRSQPDYSQREIMFLAENEKIIHLEDLLLRRSLLAMLGQVTGDLLQEVSIILAGVLGWSEARRQEEISRAATILQTRHGVAAAKLAPKPAIAS